MAAGGIPRLRRIRRQKQPLRGIAAQNLAPRSRAVKTIYVLYDQMNQQNR